MSTNPAVTRSAALDRLGAAWLALAGAEALLAALVDEARARGDAGCEDDAAEAAVTIGVVQGDLRRVAGLLARRGERP